jgi:hypothetical protein
MKYLADPMIYYLNLPGAVEALNIWFILKENILLLYLAKSVSPGVYEHFRKNKGSTTKFI